MRMHWCYWAQAWEEITLGRWAPNSCPQPKWNSAVPRQKDGRLLPVRRLPDAQTWALTSGPWQIRGRNGGTGRMVAPHRSKWDKWEGVTNAFFKCLEMWAALQCFELWAALQGICFNRGIVGIQYSQENSMGIPSIHGNASGWDIHFNNNNSAWVWIFDCRLSCSLWASERQLIAPGFEYIWLLPFNNILFLLCDVILQFYLNFLFLLYIVLYVLKCSECWDDTLQTNMVKTFPFQPTAAGTVCATGQKPLFEGVWFLG